MLYVDKHRICQECEKYQQGDCSGPDTDEFYAGYYKYMIINKGGDLKKEIVSCDHMINSFTSRKYFIALQIALPIMYAIFFALIWYAVPILPIILYTSSLIITSGLYFYTIWCRYIRRWFRNKIEPYTK